MQHLKQIFTLGFVIYFLGISLGFSVNLHYCDGKVENITLFNHDASCSMEAMQSCGVNTQQCTEHKSYSYDCASCCNDLSVYLHFESMPITSQYLFDVFPFEVHQPNRLILPLDELIVDIYPRFYDEKEKPPSFPPLYISLNQRLVYA